MTKQVTLENTLLGGFGLPGGQVVPGKGSITVEPEIWASAKGHPVVAARLAAGTLIADGQGRKPESDGSDQSAELARLNDELAKAQAEIARLTTLIPASTGPEAKHRGAGSYSIMEGDAELREKLTKDQAEAFNALDDAGKTKWLADNPKPAA